MLPYPEDDNGKKNSEETEILKDLDRSKSRMTPTMEAVKPPKPFLQSPNDRTIEIRDWIEKFELYLDLSMPAVDDRKKSKLLLYYVGDEARRILTPRLRREMNFSSFKEEVAAAFGKKETILSRRLKLIETKQKSNVQEFANELKRNAALCELGQYEEKLIQVIFIAGIKSSDMKRRLRTQKEGVTLQETIELAKTIEEITAEKKIVARPESTEIMLMSDKNRSPSRPGRVMNRSFGRPKEAGSCGRCGYDHGAGRCPANRKICNRCKKPNHFRAVCRADLTNNIVEEILEEENPYDDGSGVEVNSVFMVEEQEETTQEDSQREQPEEDSQREQTEEDSQREQTEEDSRREQTKEDSPEQTKEDSPEQTKENSGREKTKEDSEKEQTSEDSPDDSRKDSQREQTEEDPRRGQTKEDSPEPNPEDIQSESPEADTFDERHQEEAEMTKTPEVVKRKRTPTFDVSMIKSKSKMIGKTTQTGTNPVGSRQESNSRKKEIGECELKEIVEENRWDEVFPSHKFFSLKKYAAELEILEGKVLYKKKVVVTDERKKMELIREGHGIHAEGTKTVKRILRYHWWPEI